MSSEFMYGPDTSAPGRDEPTVAETIEEMQHEERVAFERAELMAECAKPNAVSAAEAWDPVPVYSREDYNRIEREMAKAAFAVPPEQRSGEDRRELGINPKDAIGSRKWRLSCVSAPVLAEMSLGMLEGACKYRRHNYRVAPVRFSVYYDACMHHLMAAWEGEDIDPNSGINHISKAMSCLAVIRDAQIQGTWFDDRPPATAPGWQERINEQVKKILDTFPEKDPYLASDKPK